MTWADWIMPIPSMIAGWFGGYSNENPAVEERPPIYQSLDNAVPWIIGGLIAWAIIKKKL